MTRHAFPGLSILVLSIAISWVVALPVQGGIKILQHDEYGPPPVESFGRYFLSEDRGPVDPRNPNDIDVQLVKQAHRGLDPFSRAAFGSKRFLSARPYGSLRQPANLDETERFAKRNIDEIDRTAFDSFFKRNLDEIDRVGWSGFVKKLDESMANRQHF